MTHIISATAKYARSGHSGKRLHFLFQSYELLQRARLEAAAGHCEEAFEYAYQAALRGAGSWVAGTPVSQRRRLPSSAWDRLALTGIEGRRWSGKLRAYSRQRSRLITGLDDAVDMEAVLRLISVVAEFLDAVEGGGTYSAVA